MKIIITEDQLGILTESLTQTDKTEIERMIRKEIKTTLDDSKFKKKSLKMLWMTNTSLKTLKEN